MKNNFYTTEAKVFYLKQRYPFSRKQAYIYMDKVDIELMEELSQYIYGISYEEYLTYRDKRTHITGYKKRLDELDILRVNQINKRNEAKKRG